MTYSDQEIKDFVKRIKENFKVRLTYTQFLSVVTLQLTEMESNPKTSENKLKFFTKVKQHLTVKAIVECMNP